MADRPDFAALARDLLALTAEEIRGTVHVDDVQEALRHAYASGYLDAAKAAMNSAKMGTWHRALDLLRTQGEDVPALIERAARNLEAARENPVTDADALAAKPWDVEDET